MSFPRRPLVLAVVLLCALPVRRRRRLAGAARPVARAGPLPLRRQAAGQASRRTFLDDAAACILYAGTTYLVEADGTVETITHEVTRLNGRKGVEKLGEYRNITYDPVLPEAHPQRGPHPQGRRPRSSPSSRATSSSATSAPTTRSTTTRSSSSSASPAWKSATSSRSSGPCAARTPSTPASSSPATPSATPTYPVVRDELRVRAAEGHAASSTPPSTARSSRRVTEDRRPASSTTGRRPTASGRRRTRTCRRKEELRPAVACSTFASWEEVGRWKQQAAQGLLGLHRRTSRRSSREVTQRPDRRRPPRPAP